jgi:hypothetical protein
MNKLNPKTCYKLLITLLVALFIASPARGQGDNTLDLRLSRDFGFSSGSGQIQGTFTIHASGPASLTRVDFFIDGKQIGEATSAPFNLQFNTGNFTLGSHAISAVGYTNSGQELQSQTINAEFVTPETGLKSAGRIAIPILVIAGLAVLFSAIFPLLRGRGKRSQLPLGTPRNYGLRGGGICPKCGRPFPFSLLTMNLPFARFDRCPFCGHWGLIKISPLADLRKAEAAELDAAKASQPIPEESEEEKLRKELDDSRFSGG